MHRFTGRWNKQYDTTTNLILMGARPYNPTTGRFLAVDPIPGGSLNNYDYAGQDPINNYDLSGTWPCFLNPVCVYHTVKGANSSPWAHGTVASAVTAAKAVRNHKGLVLGMAVFFAAGPAIEAAGAEVGAADVHAALRAIANLSLAYEKSAHLSQPGTGIYGQIARAVATLLKVFRSGGPHP